jgi:hypothetical protein
MADIYIKKYWEEENIIIFLHFNNYIAVRQIEIYLNKTIYLDEKNPIKENSILCDQTLDYLTYEGSDIISQQEFELIWRKNGEIY